MTASSVIRFPTHRAAAAMPVNKLRVQEQVRQLVRENVMPRSALFVVVYLGEITDKESGLATVELGTIADRTGYSRGGGRARDQIPGLLWAYRAHLSPAGKALPCSGFPAC